MSSWNEEYRNYLKSPEWAKRRKQVLERSKGVCESCNTKPATEVHHTTYDHVFDEPLWELRAVCRECHEQISEADGVDIHPEVRAQERKDSGTVKKFTDREWQKDGVDQCVSRAFTGSDRALLYACPGAGKTYAALRIASVLIERFKKTSEILVVTPNLAIRSQWIATAEAMGIDLEEVTNASVLLDRQTSITFGAPHGFILGYQTAVNHKHDLRVFCEMHRPVAILDEVHHTAGRSTARDGNAWGHAIEYACDKASFKLPTTGTPFREGNDPIAFVDYNSAGEAVALVKYKYGQAIADGVCRRVEFEMFDGWVEWKTKGGRSIVSNFEQRLSQKLSRERLRAYLSTEGEMPAKMLAAAHDRLMSIRSGTGADAMAAGLVVAMDIAHANQIAELLEVITGEAPVVVHDEIDQAQEKINAFRGNTEAKWIVGVSMISEGVDIKRLRVGVYATNSKARLYFQQFVGRFTRVQDSRNERSFVFLPNDEDIEALASEIERDYCHILGEDPPVRGRRKGPVNPRRPAIDVIGSDGNVVAIVGEGMTLPVEFIREHQPTVDAFKNDHPELARGRTDHDLLRLHVAMGVIEAPKKKAG